MRRAWLRFQPRFVPPLWFVARAPISARHVALTFDDGPSPATTLPLLDTLDRCGVRATFFFVGKDVAAYPDLVQETVARGHQVSNHGFDHSVRPSHGWKANLANLLQGEDVLRAATLRCAWRWFRPPRGQFHLRLLAWAARHERTVVTWSLDSGDSFGGAAEVCANLHPARVAPGEVVLLHEDKLLPRDLLLELVARLRAAGRSFSTLEQLIGVR